MLVRSSHRLLPHIPLQSFQGLLISKVGIGNGATCTEIFAPASKQSLFVNVGVALSHLLTSEAWPGGGGVTSIGG